MFASAPDLLRLVAIPVLGWAALSDIRTRRVPNRLWLPLAGLGIALLLWDLLAHLPPTTFDDRLFLVQVGVSVVFVVPFSYLFWRIGGFGGADAKALIALALLLPTYPVYFLPSTALPLVEAPLGVFSFTILTNTVVVAVVYPLVIGVGNLLSGDVAPIMFFGRRIDVADLPSEHGRLFETPSGYTRGGLDLDALRMYLRWRGSSFEDLLATPHTLRDPATVDETFEPTDGRVDPTDVATDGGVAQDAAAADRRDTAVTPPAPDAETFDDPWAAEQFLDSIEGTAYGTTPEALRDGLELVSTHERVWISPGIPFLVPMFVGLLLAVSYGDVLFGLLAVLGLA
ncbi:prepilin peptidase [Salinigranum halophilum]|jgi:preflagellin peptidase FlaK|uniref:prepilin peptidase n=1 Tax=Salinigranum halophilum TaxID=2565931 RepID=UPI00115E0299|nr:prepilin peptidase [Salinigranum halophilum]